MTIVEKSTYARMCTFVHTQDTQKRFLEKQYLTEFSKVLNLLSLVYSYFLFIYVVNELPGVLCSNFCDYVWKRKPAVRILEISLITKCFKESLTKKRLELWINRIGKDLMFLHLFCFLRMKLVIKKGIKNNGAQYKEGKLKVKFIKISVQPWD